jgi:choline kinase
MSGEVAVLLCAGVGSRLRPLTDDRPKALVDVGGETILARAVRLLVASGVREIIAATGYREDAVRAALAGCAVPVSYCPNPAFDRTQNSVSLLLCREAVRGRPFYKLDGDVLFHPEILTRLSRANAPLAAAVERRDDLGDEEMKVLVEGDRIRSFGKGLDPRASFGESIGIERVTGDAVSLLFHALAATCDAGITHLYYEDVYATLIAGGLGASAVDISDLAWTEIDTPEDLAKARELVGSGALDAPVRRGA